GRPGGGERTMKPRIIGLAGPAGSGKSTVAAILRSRHAYCELPFAKRIKDALANLLEIAPFELERHKEEPLPWLGVSPRYMMQTLGTEWGRTMIHPDIW